MRRLYFVHIGLVFIKYSSALRLIDDHTDSGNCTGEFTGGNSPFIPQRYSIYLDLDPEKKTFHGDVNIMGTLNDKTDEIILHSVNLTIKSVRANGRDLDDTTWFLDDSLGILSITLPSDILNSNLDNLIVGVSYDGVFGSTTGIIMQHYNATDKSRWIIFTDLQPISARTVFPCVDLPKYKARFDISIKNPGKRLVVLSNMPRKSIDPRVIKFQTTPLMSTYLVSFLVCDYVPVTTDHRQITIWVPKEMVGKFGTNLVRFIVPQLLDSLEEYTGNKYSLPKLDMFVVEETGETGGMENWGLIMFQVDSFVQSKRASVGDQVRVVYTIAHELAHHWFGNSVTVADWCNMWLQEAIPTFLHGHITDTYSYELDMVNRVKWTARQEVMGPECFSNSSYSTPLTGGADAESLFLPKHYHKGASLLYMIESLVTPEVFKNSLRSYIRKYNNSYTQEKELWEIVEEEVGEGGVQKKLNAPKSLVEIANSWVPIRSHPVVILKRNEDGSLSAGQKICNMRATENGEWWIPVSYTTSNEANFKNAEPRRWIPPMIGGFRPLNITLKDNEWIILNIMGTGLYRVQYDKHTWKLILDQLKRDTTSGKEKPVIPPIHRAMLVDDSFYTANTGEEMTRFFDIVEYVKYETDAYVWQAVLQIVWNYFPSEETALLHKYVRFLLTDVFERVVDIKQWERAYFFQLEALNDRFLREWVFDLSYTVELQAVYSFSRDVAIRVINGTMDENIIPPEIRKSLWCAAASTGDREVFEYLMIAFDSEESGKKKARIFESLQCSNTHTRMLLDLILQSEEGEDKGTLRQIVGSFIYDHWPTECEEIISFVDENKKRLVDDESQLENLFQITDECKDKTYEQFLTKYTDSMEDKQSRWRKIFGMEPLNWLRDHERQWS